MPKVFPFPFSLFISLFLSSGKVDDAISFSSLLTHDIVTMEKQMAKETGFVLNRRARQALQEETTKEKREREETDPFHPVKHRRHG